MGTLSQDSSSSEVSLPNWQNAGHTTTARSSRLELLGDVKSKNLNSACIISCKYVINHLNSKMLVLNHLNSKILQVALLYSANIVHSEDGDQVGNRVNFHRQTNIQFSSSL